MKLEEFYERLKTIGLPVSFYQFQEEEKVNPPFIVYYCVEPIVFYADNLIYYEKYKVAVELYTNEKNQELEEKLEQLFVSNEITYYLPFEETINEESLYLKRYEMEI